MVCDILIKQQYVIWIWCSAEVSETLIYLAEAEDRPICEPLCTEENSGCNSTTEYCALTATIGLGVGCCRTKLPGGEFCLPVNNGTDCQSGVCNNLIQPFEFGGITWTLGFWNLFGGYCSSTAVDIYKTSTTTTTTTMSTTTTTTTLTTVITTTNNTTTEICPISPTDPCANQIPDCNALEIFQMIDPAQVEQFCNGGLRQCCPQICMIMGCA